MSDHATHDDHIMEDLSKPSTPLQYGRLFFTGFAMGASDIVPGVSGGTMAFILGVYETLINAIKSFNFEALKLVLRFFGEGEPGKDKPSLMYIIDHVHLRFLIPLGVGLLTAVFLLASLLEEWLVTNPTYVFAFFGGLIIASVVAIGAKVKWAMPAIAALVAGTIFAFIIVGLPSLGETAGHGPLVLFASGAIAICAMILPGISGSFILLILGQYEFVLGAVRGRDILSLIYVALGALVGILAFSRILSWLLKNYENTTIAVLVGFMVGSLRLIVHRALYPQIEEGEEVIETVVQLDVTIIAISLLLILIGFLVVSFLDHLQSRNNPVFSLLSNGKTAQVPATES